MPNYTVVITQSVLRYLKKSPDKISNKLESAMLALEDNPRPNGYKKVEGQRCLSDKSWQL